MRFDFDELKTRVSVVAVLRVYGLHGDLREERGELVGPCPLPRHGGDRSNRGAFRASPAMRLWRCFTSCGGGDVVDLTMALEGCGYAEAARVLDRIAGGAEAGVSRPRPPVVLAAARPFAPYTQALRLEPDHAFLRARGIASSTARTFEAGWWPLGGLLRGCVGVRLHDPAGNPLGYAGRRPDWDERSAFPKWRLPLGFPKSDVLFNWHRAKPHVGDGVVVVEGPWDAMRVAQTGFRCVVALLGTTLHPAQRALIVQAPKVLLMLDGDDAGRTSASTVRARLGPRRVDLVNLPDGKDPADLVDEELRVLLASFFSSPCPTSSP